MQYNISIYDLEVGRWGYIKKRGCIWGSARTLIAAERCLFAPNMFVNVGLTNLKEKNMFSAGFKSSAMF